MPARNHGGGRCSPGLAGWPMFPHPWDPAGMPAVFTNTQTYRASIQALFGRPGLPLIASTSSRSDTSTMRARLCINPKLEVITTLCDQYVCHTWHPWGRQRQRQMAQGPLVANASSSCWLLPIRLLPTTCRAEIPAGRSSDASDNGKGPPRGHCLQPLLAAAYHCHAGTPPAETTVSRSGQGAPRHAKARTTCAR